jgi:septum formation protein
MYRNYPFRIILASASPRRKELLEQLGFSFSVEIKSIDETPIPTQTPIEAALHIASEKMNAFSLDYFPDNTLIITSDTVVALEDEILGKPISHYDAKLMLQKLSGREHQVITAVCLKSAAKSTTFYDVTTVRFSEMSDEEIEYYIQNYQPFDKAGSYGIQEWIGLGFIASINGSYSNVVGLPTEKLRKELMNFATGIQL